MSQPLPSLQMGNHNSPTVLRFGDGVGAALAVILGHIFTLLEGGSLVLQNVSDTEGVAVKSPLLAQFGAIWAQGLIVNLREVYVFAFIHHVTLFLVNISWKNQNIKTNHIRKKKAFSSRLCFVSAGKRDSKQYLILNLLYHINLKREPQGHHYPGMMMNQDEADCLRKISKRSKSVRIK